MIRPIDIAAGLQAFATRTPTLPPASHTNSYAIGERDVLLVEPATPYEDEQREWLGWARGLTSQGRRLVALFLTHHHADHVGGATVLGRELSLPIWAHAETRSRVADVPVTRTLADGESIVLDGARPQQWSVLHTPGHAPGHLCLFEGSLGHLVVGDMVASEGTILIEPTDGDMSEYLRQLERLNGLGARMALPAHGAPILDPASVFVRYLRHRRMRESKIQRVIARFPSGATLDEIVPLAYDDAPSAALGLARLSVEAHLVKLEREGLVAFRGERYHSTMDGVSVAVIP